MMDSKRNDKLGDWLRKFKFKVRDVLRKHFWLSRAFLLQRRQEMDEKQF
jgi:hypothetical protein